MIKCIETSEGIIFTNHVVRIEPFLSSKSRIYTVGGYCIAVNESPENLMFQISNNRKPEEGEL